MCLHMKIKRVWIPKKTESSCVCLHSNTSAVGRVPNSVLDQEEGSEVEDRSQLVEGFQTAKKQKKKSLCPVGNAAVPAQLAFWLNGNQNRQND